MILPICHIHENRNRNHKNNHIIMFINTNGTKSGAIVLMFVDGWRNKQDLMWMRSHGTVGGAVEYWKCGRHWIAKITTCSGLLVILVDFSPLFHMTSKGSAKIIMTAPTTGTLHLPFLWIVSSFRTVGVDFLFLMKNYFVDVGRSITTSHHAENVPQRPRRTKTHGVFVTYLMHYWTWK